MVGGCDAEVIDFGRSAVSAESVRDVETDYTFVAVADSAKVLDSAGVDIYFLESAIVVGVAISPIEVACVAVKLHRLTEERHAVERKDIGAFTGLLVDGEEVTLLVDGIDDAINADCHCTHIAIQVRVDYDLLACLEVD